MSWHRDSTGLWCPCFQAYQPDNGGGCPAYPCPENTRISVGQVLTEPQEGQRDE